MQWIKGKEPVDLPCPEIHRNTTTQGIMTGEGEGEPLKHSGRVCEIDVGTHTQQCSSVHFWMSATVPQWSPLCQGYSFNSSFLFSSLLLLLFFFSLSFSLSLFRVASGQLCFALLLMCRLSQCELSRVLSLLHSLGLTAVPVSQLVPLPSLPLSHALSLAHSLSLCMQFCLSVADQCFLNCLSKWKSTNILYNLRRYMISQWSMTHITVCRN